jgi:cold shock CspA family protein
METPLQLEIVGFQPSLHLQHQIETNIARLERRYGRITACRVAIRAPDAHHAKGEPCTVNIRLALPNHRNVSVKLPPKGLDARQADVTFALNDAFRRADRQLADHASRLKGRPRERDEQPAGKIVRLDPNGEFGFLETDDGREIYFHANSVLDKKFKQLKPGARVVFHEEQGEKGPQASTVRIDRAARRDAGSK